LSGRASERYYSPNAAKSLYVGKITPRFIEMLLADIAKKAGVQKKVTAGILRDTFVVRSVKRGEGIENVLRKIGLNESTWEDAKEKYQRLAGRAI